MFDQTAFTYFLRKKVQAILEMYVILYMSSYKNFQLESEFQFSLNKDLPKQKKDFLKIY